MKNREALVERILTYLTFSEEWFLTEDAPRGIGMKQVQYLKLPLTYFQGAEVLPGGDEWLSTKQGESDFFDVENSETVEELQRVDLGVWSVAMLRLPGPGFPARQEATGLYDITRVRKVKMPELRGIVRARSTGDFVECAWAAIYNDGKYHTRRTLFERISKSKWIAVFQGEALKSLCETDSIEEGSLTINCHKTIALTRYYDWRVEIGFETPGRTTLPTIAIPTDPEGAKLAYRFRDVAPGKSRRDALRHWVRTHYRRTSEYDETTIWAHLRGVEEFTHNGMRCRIVPSDYDLKKAAEYQAKRKKA